MMTERKPKAPAGLGARGGRFWRQTVGEFTLTDAELNLLTEVCRTLDTLDDLAAAVAAEGATTTGSTGQVVVHPAVAEARHYRLVLHRLVAALELPDEDGTTIPTAHTIRGRETATAQWRGKDTEAAARRAELRGISGTA